MTDKDHRQAETGWRGVEGDQFDRELDASLAKYAAVEPRAGLEDRVLANLRTERERVPDRSWWRWTASAAVAIAAVVIVMLALLGKPDRRHTPAIATHPVITAPIAKQSGSRVASSGPENGAHPPVPSPTIRRVTHRVQPTTVAETHPKLDQFPSPRPLSEQEKILESYVANYPEHAALIARARAEELRRDAAEEMNTGEAGSEKGAQQ